MVRKERGQIIVLAVFMIVLLASLPSLFRLLKQSSQQTSDNLRYNALADNISIGGLEDAVSWFRRQNNPPVGRLYQTPPPAYDDAAFSPTNDATEKGGSVDPPVGLVKEYELSSEDNLWARHEIRRQADPLVKDPLAAHDITPLRVPGAPAGSGLVWELTSVGIVFRRIDPTLPYNASPNKIFARSTFASEIRFFSFQPPPGPPAAIYADNISMGYNNGTTVYGDVRVRTRVIRSTPNDISIIGNLTEWDPTINSISLANTFGISPEELQQMADETTANSNTYFANLTNTLMYLRPSRSDGEVRAYELSGSGFVIVDCWQSLMLYTANVSEFRGVLYVRKMAANAVVNFHSSLSFKGMIISEVPIWFSSPGWERRQVVTYDQSAIDEAWASLGNYRERVAPRRVERRVP